MRLLHRNRLIIAGLIAGLLVAVAGAARVYDHTQRHRLAPGIKIDGIDVGGMSVVAARERLSTLAAAPRRRVLRVQADGRTFTLTPQQLHVTVDLDAALARAVADSHRGWLGARVVGDITGRRVDERLPIPTHYTPGVIPRLVGEIAARTDRAPSDASVTPSAGGLLTTASRPGRAVDTGTLKVALDHAARNPRRPATIEATTHTVAAKVSATDLARTYVAYIIVDRKAHVLRFYQHLKLADTYPIAVGKSGLETPAGLYDVQWKQVNPPWYVPNSPWAGKLAGKTIPPGPDDPIKARWLAFNGGAGIHGIDPSEYSSIGHDASHGCVRMRIPDVISLYAHTPVKSPVFVA